MCTGKNRVDCGHRKRRYDELRASRIHSWLALSGAARRGAGHWSVGSDDHPTNTGVITFWDSTCLRADLVILR